MTWSLETALILLLTLPPVASPFIYLAGRLSVRRANGHCRLARCLAIAALLATWVPLLITGQAILRGQVIETMIGSISLRMDGISLLLAGTALLLGTLVLLFSIPYMAGEEGEEKYYALLPALIGMIIGLGVANDLFNMWVWFEAMTVTSYLLVIFYANERGALEAGVKYLVQSAVGSVLVLLAISMVYAEAHTLILTEIASTPSWTMSLGLDPLTLAAGALFVIGFGVKTALVPLHTWLPDAHSQAPSGISALLSGVVIESGLIAILRSVGNLPGLLPGNSPLWGYLLLGFGALNILFGNMMALRQVQVKRLLAYSSLSHVGYMLLGFGVAIAYRQTDAAAGGFFHLLTHGLMKGLAFLAAGALLYTLHIARGDHAPLTIDDLNGASKRYPLPAFALSVAVLALAGLPPLAGFMSKWQIFAAGAMTHSLPVILLVVFAALNSVLSLGYYAPLVNRMYRRNPSAVVMAGGPVSAWMSAPLMALTLMVVAIGFWPALVTWFTGPAASALLGMFGYY